MKKTTTFTGADLDTVFSAGGIIDEAAVKADVEAEAVLAVTAGETPYFDDAIENEEPVVIIASSAPKAEILRNKSPRSKRKDKIEAIAKVIPVEEF